MDERRLAGLLFSHFAKTRVTRLYKTPYEKHPNLPPRCGKGDSVAAAADLGRVTGRQHCSRDVWEKTSKCPHCRIGSLEIFFSLSQEIQRESSRTVILEFWREMQEENLRRRHRLQFRHHRCRRKTRSAP